MGRIGSAIMFHSLLLSHLFISAWALMTPGDADPNDCTHNISVNLNLTIIGKSDSKVEGWEVCRDECSEDPSCDYWRFNLKDSKCRFLSTKYHKNDKLALAVKLVRRVSAWETCRDICNTDPECEYFRYNKKWTNCRLMAPDYHHNEDRVAGASNCV